MEVHILLELQENRQDWLTTILKAISHIGDFGLVWIVLAVLFLVTASYRLLGIKVLTALTLVLLLNNLLLKNLIDRQRPFEVISELSRLVAEPAGASFPSGHTAGAFAAGWLLYKYLPRRYGLPLLILGALMGFSRMYVGVHYPSDVLAGAVVGCLCGWLADLLITKYWIVRKSHKK